MKLIIRLPKSAEVERLEARIAALEARVKALELPEVPPVPHHLKFVIGPITKQPLSHESTGVSADAGGGAGGSTP